MDDELETLWALPGSPSKAAPSHETGTRVVDTMQIMLDKFQERLTETLSSQLKSHSISIRQLLEDHQTVVAEHIPRRPPHRITAHKNRSEPEPPNSPPPVQPVQPGLDPGRRSSTTPLSTSGAWSPTASCPAPGNTKSRQSHANQHFNSIRDIAMARRKSGGGDAQDMARRFSVFGRENTGREKSVRKSHGSEKKITSRKTAESSQGQTLGQSRNTQSSAEEVLEPGVSSMSSANFLAVTPFAGARTMGSTGTIDTTSSTLDRSSTNTSTANFITDRSSVQSASSIESAGTCFLFDEQPHINTVRSTKISEASRESSCSSRASHAHTVGFASEASRPSEGAGARSTGDSTESGITRDSSRDHQGNVRTSNRPEKTMLQRGMTEQMGSQINAQMNVFQKITEIDADDKERLSFVSHTGFSVISAMAIFLNTLYLGLQSDFAVKESYVGESFENPFNFMYCDLAFLLAFVVEVGLRCYSQGLLSFYFGRDFKWNRLDTIVVLGTIVDFCVEYLSDSPGFGLIMLRSFRLFRLIRLSRAARFVRMLGQLQIMIYSLYGCMSSFMPALLLLFFVMYMFSIVLLQGVARHLQDNADDGQSELLIKHFGSLAQGLWTLLAAVSGGEDWMRFVEPIAEVNVFYRMVFALYICLVLFGVLNILTGIFVNVAMQSCNISREIVTERQMREKDHLIKNIVEAFMEADKDCNGALSFEEFQEYVLDENVRAYFLSLDIDVASAERIFTLLDDSDDGQVDLLEFVEGCLLHRGHATAIDTFFLEGKCAEVLDAIERIEYLVGSMSSPAEDFEMVQPSKSEGNVRLVSR